MSVAPDTLLQEAVLLHRQGDLARGGAPLSAGAGERAGQCRCALLPRDGVLPAGPVRRRGGVRAEGRRGAARARACAQSARHGARPARPQRRSPGAVRCGDRADGNFAEAHGNRGNALSDLGRTEEAVASYERAVALAPELDRRLDQPRRRPAPARPQRAGARELRPRAGAAGGCSRGAFQSRQHPDATSDATRRRSRASTRCWRTARAIADALEQSRPCADQARHGRTTRWRVSTRRSRLPPTMSARWSTAASHSKDLGRLDDAVACLRARVGAQAGRGRCVGQSRQLVLAMKGDNARALAAAVQALAVERVGRGEDAVRRSACATAGSPSIRARFVR